MSKFLGQTFWMSLKLQSRISCLRIWGWMYGWLFIARWKKINVLKGILLCDRERESETEKEKEEKEKKEHIQSTSFLVMCISFQLEILTEWAGAHVSPGSYGAEQYAILPSTLYLLKKVFSENGVQRINGDMITFGDRHINLYIVKLYVFMCGYIYTSILKSKIIEYSYKIRTLHEMQISVILRKLFVF